MSEVRKSEKVLKKSFPSLLEGRSTYSWLSC